VNAIECAKAAARQTETMQNCFANPELAYWQFLHCPAKIV